MSGDFTFLKGNIETIILCSLYNNDKYGYEIAKEIKERTSNKYEIKQPTLYSYLKRLEEDDLIVSYWGENSNGGRRRYYKLTKTGKSNCEQFISEWQYQRSVLSDLVDGTAEGTEIKQEEATPLFGRRSPKKERKSAFKSAIDEQDEIARRLSELMEQQNDDVASNEEQQQAEQQESVSAAATQSEETETTATAFTATEARQNTAAETRQISLEEYEQARARFEVNQDNADVFLQNFEERAKEVSEREPSEQQEGENYQHVLMGVLGDQLEEMRETSQNDAHRSAYYNEQPLGLEDVADSLAKEGIRIRIYNHATAVYKSKMLIPLSKVLCQTAWIAYAVAFIYYGILALTSISVKNWSPFIITVGALLIIPIGFSINAIIDPTRRDKPAFNFKVAIITTAVIGAIIVLAAVGFSAIANTEFSNYVAVSQQILIPLGIALLLPISILVYNLFYKRY